MPDEVFKSIAVKQIVGAATSDTPTVNFDDDGTASKAPDAAPAGYIEVVISGTKYYIPYWS